MIGLQYVIKKQNFFKRSFKVVGSTKVIAVCIWLSSYFLIYADYYPNLAGLFTKFVANFSLNEDAIKVIFAPVKWEYILSLSQGFSTFSLQVQAFHDLHIFKIAQFAN